MTINIKAPALSLERALTQFFFNAVRIGIAHPNLLAKALGIFLSQRRLAAVRKQKRRQGIEVPPFLIFSITQRCNLACKGCYAIALSKSEGFEIEEGRIAQILTEAEGLGVSIALIAGGEPLIRKEIIGILGRFPRIVFPLFTNGLLIDDAIIAALRKRPNVFPIISIEGNRAYTDSRRGAGVYDSVIRTIAKLRRAAVLCGISLTVTRDNFPMVTSAAFIERCLRQGCLIFFFVEYVPVEDGAGSSILSDEQRSAMSRISMDLSKRYRALFIAFPGDEGQFGGCLAAGRGFIHINSFGEVEPCPFAPYSDSSLIGSSLQEALKSPLLRAIRDHHELLAGTEGGCALWENRDLVTSLVCEEKRKKERS